MLVADESSGSEDELPRMHLKMIGHKNKIARSIYYRQLRVLLERYENQS